MAVLFNVCRIKCLLVSVKRLAENHFCQSYNALIPLWFSAEWIALFVYWTNCPVPALLVSAFFLLLGEWILS